MPHLTYLIIPSNPFLTSTYTTRHKKKKEKNYERQPDTLDETRNQRPTLPAIVSQLNPACSELHPENLHTESNQPTKTSNEGGKMPNESKSHPT